MSATATSSALFTASNCLSRSCPRAPTPIIPTRTRSFAPKTRAEADARNAAPAAVFLMKSRRVLFDIVVLVDCPGIKNKTIKDTKEHEGKLSCRKTQVLLRVLGGVFLALGYSERLRLL